MGEGFEEVERKGTGLIWIRTAYGFTRTAVCVALGCGGGEGGSGRL